MIQKFINAIPPLVVLTVLHEARRILLYELLLFLLLLLLACDLEAKHMLLAPASAFFTPARHSMSEGGASPIRATAGARD